MLRITSYILSDKDLRQRVQAWNIKSRPGGISVGIKRDKSYTKIHGFALNLIDDMHASRSEIFG